MIGQVIAILGGFLILVDAGTELRVSPTKHPYSTADGAKNEQVLHEGVVSPKGTFRVEYERSPGDDPNNERIVLVTKRGRQPLPSEIVWLDFPWSGDKDARHGRSDQMPDAGGCYFSPDERWLCVSQKLFHGCSIAHLYKRQDLTFQRIGSLEFDLMAWHYYVKSHGLRRSHVPSNKDPRLHIFDFIRWSGDSRYLVFRLRPLPGYTQKQGWGWIGHYDTRKRRFGPGYPRRIHH